jgi:hypothetical protein
MLKKILPLALCGALISTALGKALPPDFAWGVATAAYQIEGAAA